MSAPEPYICPDCRGTGELDHGEWCTRPECEAARANQEPVTTEEIEL